MAIMVSKVPQVLHLHSGKFGSALICHLFRYLRELEGNISLWTLLCYAFFLQAETHFLELYGCLWAFFSTLSLHKELTMRNFYQSAIHKTQNLATSSTSTECLTLTPYWKMAKREWSISQCLFRILCYLRLRILSFSLKSWGFIDHPVQSFKVFFDSITSEQQ